MNSDYNVLLGNELLETCRNVCKVILENETTTKLVKSLYLLSYKSCP